MSLISRLLINQKCSLLCLRSLTSSWNKPVIFAKNARSIFQRVDSKVGLKYKQKDKIPEDYNVVYRCPFQTTINLIHVGVLVVGSILVPFVGYCLWTNQVEVEDDPRANMRFNNLKQLRYAIAGLTAILITLQILCVRTVLRIYFNGKQFVSVTNGSLGPLYQRKLSHLPGECARAPNTKFSFWSELRYVINDKSVIIVEDYFRLNTDYNRMLGREI